MKTILVATDFSPVATNAANYAADMAMAINADISLLHIFQIPVVYSEIPVAFTAEDLEKDSEKNILELKNQLTQKSGGKLKIKTEIRQGVFFTELQSACENYKPYAVVMGSQGSTVADRLLFGGHTINAMKNLAWPLITVPPEATFSAVKKIGLACDFDNVVDTTPVDEIRMLVKDFNAELHILNTGKQEVFDPNIVFQSGLLQKMLDTLKPNYHFITNENTDEGILDFTEKNNIDLLVVLPKRHKLLDRLMHKSHTKQMVLHSHVPVMALHQ